ncbi:sugar transferase [Devosia sp. XJ19-1]|uniref:Sugar transferase n=1 Tax=Devosia ureilytica TaxID=2952754 RepID=A0A9Q4FR62_9HYPH|nr:sugar transferase [Devosia ureilytica]MCP8882623.1 sugar transferase [Devosia ureilytica]MCP8885490.1 sugar transferase [Devosia ureilytica]
MRAFLGPVILAIVVQAVIYTYVITRPGRSDWHNITTAIAALSLVPCFAALILNAFRRNEAPIVVSSVVSAALFSVAVSVLSAMRVPLSYQALVSCLPVTIVLATYANLRVHREFEDHVALAPFSRDLELSVELGKIPILRGPDADLKDVETLLIDPLEHHSPEWSRLLATCYLRGVEVMPWTRYLEEKRGRLDVTSFETSHLAYRPGQLLYARLKRFFDLIAAVVTLPITVPLGLLTALYIQARDRGPVLYVQIRRGYGDRRFRMYKLRTMYQGAGGGSTGVKDNRIIPGCRLIRKLRLDELPQIINILQGDMSLIGPRPVAEYVSRSSEAVEPKYALRSLVLPGITGWAQVTTGYAGNTEEELEKLSYDLYYIKHLSLDLDLLILFKTIKTVMFGLGAR